MIEVKSFDEIDKLIAEKDFVLFDFWATWCGSCRMLMPVINQLEESTPHLTIVSINVDEFPDLSSRYDIQVVPTLVLFKNHQEVASRSGFASFQELSDWIADNN